MYTNKINYFFLFLASFILLESCQKEYINPNAATKESVILNVDGLLGLCVGVRQQFAVGPTSPLYNSISANGLTTKELYVINTGNGELTALETGGANVGGTNSFVSNIWTGCNLVKTNAQILIDNAVNISDPGTANGVRIYGHLFKALAIGTMAQFWENVPIEVLSANDFINGKRARFVPRNDALQESVNLLETAATALNSGGISATFTTKVGNDLDLKNSIQALLARYYNMLGDHSKSLTAANNVVLSTKSSFNYDAVTTNPVFRTSLVTNNVYNGLVNFGLAGNLLPDPADARIGFYLGNNTAPVKITGFFKTDSDRIPLYLPGEILLIKAEALARQGGTVNLDNAIIALNEVLTKTNDVFGVTAKLPAYLGPNDQQAILNEIYKQRCIELYLSGMKLEDSRRFGRPGPLDVNPERNRNFYPYPNSERDNNPNTPSDPSI